jgi:hypothetical protein
MQIPKNSWDLERAASWLRKHAWGEGGEAPAPALDTPMFAAQTATADVQGTAQPEPEPEPAVAESEEEIDIAGWPALVAPFYD